MVALTWDGTGEKLFETGVDHGVLYLPDVNGLYSEGYAWNGLTTVTESPSGAESNKQYADNQVYLNLLSAEEFAGTIEAFTYPDKFAECDGTYRVASGGVLLGQQARRSFGLSYRTLIGNDTQGIARGYKLHLVYGALASPSEKAYGTINESPEALAFSWEFDTTPVAVGVVDGLERRPLATLTIDSTKYTTAQMKVLEDILYGSGASDPRLPLPAEVVSLFAGAITSVRLQGANAPTYNGTTRVVTIPAVTGVQWKVNGVNKTAGAQPAMTVGQTSVVTAVPLTGYTITGDDDWTFDY